jgi:hypothetical protein
MVLWLKIDDASGDFDLQCTNLTPTGVQVNPRLRTSLNQCSGPSCQTCALALGYSRLFCLVPMLCAMALSAESPDLFILGVGPDTAKGTVNLTKPDTLCSPYLHQVPTACLSSGLLISSPYRRAPRGTRYVAIAPHYALIIHQPASLLPIF